MQSSCSREFCWQDVVSTHCAWLSRRTQRSADAVHIDALYEDADLPPSHDKRACEDFSDDDLITKELSHRRSIASFITSLTLTSGATVISSGTLIPLSVPIIAFKSYKLHSHKRQLSAVRAELALRCLTPKDRRKRDVLVPVAIAASVHVVTFGVADIVDIMPSDVQAMLEDPARDVMDAAVADTTGIDDASDDKMERIANGYQAFVIAEGATRLATVATDRCKSHE